MLISMDTIGGLSRLTSVDLIAAAAHAFGEMLSVCMWARRDSLSHFASLSLKAGVLRRTFSILGLVG